MPEDVTIKNIDLAVPIMESPVALQPSTNKFGDREEADLGKWYRDSRVWGNLETRQVPVDTMKTGITRVKEQMDIVVGALGENARTANGFLLEEIKLGVALTAQGHFAIATVGVKASIEFTFKRHVSDT